MPMYWATIYAERSPKRSLGDTAVAGNLIQYRVVYLTGALQLHRWDEFRSVPAPQPPKGA